jgi:NADPH-dependent glutamate synthase beta subunit-like oxidoreductase
VRGEDNRLTGIEYTEFDTGEKHDMDADLLIIGSGRCPELVFIPEIKDEPDTENLPSKDQGPLRWEGHELQKKPDGNREAGLLSDQDVISEYASVVAAINGGRKAAAALHCLMTGTGFQDPSLMITETSNLQDVAFLKNVDPIPRTILKLTDQLHGSPEAFSTGFSPEEAKKEADRCLRCGLVCYEKTKLEGRV